MIVDGGAENGQTAPMFWCTTALAAAPSSDLVFVGNSYTARHGVDQMTAQLFAADGDVVSTVRLTEGGFTWAQHVDRVEAGDARWARLRDEPHAWVVLQEQSEIPGFPQSNPEWQASAAAADTLDGWAEASGAETVLFLTWGREAGDDANPDLYPDYPTMQALLEDGYLAIRDRLSTEARPVWVAPVGLAFQAVYDAEVAAGRDPLAPGGAFVQLYEGDGSHPTVAGTFLAACTIYATITGRTPIGLPGPEGLSAEDAARLEAVADAVVVQQAVDLDYPWEREGEAPPPPPERADGCGCRGAPGGAGWVLAALALGNRRARRVSDGACTPSSPRRGPPPSR